MPLAGIALANTAIHLGLPVVRALAANAALLLASLV